jgi:hypothetical protein
LKKIKKRILLLVELNSLLKGGKERQTIRRKEKEREAKHEKEMKRKKTK